MYLLVVVLAGGSSWHGSCLVAALHEPLSIIHAVVRPTTPWHCGTEESLSNTKADDVIEF